MKRSLLLTLGLVIAGLSVRNCHQDPRYIKIAVTTDVHGMVFPVDPASGEELDYSLSHVYDYISRQKQAQDTTFFILDNGDFLQGQPAVYYYNFVDTVGEHLSSRIMNFMGYAAGTVGNHDIEAGPEVYNKIREEFHFPWLAANAIHSSTGLPYFEPFTVLKAGSCKIALLGMITPGIPNWLPQKLWPDMHFRDMVETAREWVPLIEETVHPDLLIGLFHSGLDYSYSGSDYHSNLNENATIIVAREVPGFDIIFAGHDHRVNRDWVINSSGDSVLIIDPGSHARYVGEAVITLPPDKKGKASFEGRIIPISAYKNSKAFMKKFRQDLNLVKEYVSDTVVYLAEDIQTIDAIFGPAPVTSLIHELQMKLSNADISFTAPLSVHATLPAGYLRVSDMFDLYRYENALYVMELSGYEIDRFLEYAVSLWFNVMKSPSDHLLLFSDNGSARLKNSAYNFSSAAGIRYTVDLNKTTGDRVTISEMDDGTIFSTDKTYRVALNSYRGTGGGGHLTAGAGIPKDELKNRIVWTSERDLRYYLMQELLDRDTLYPAASDNWKLIPESFYASGKMADKTLLDRQNP
ncbi:MAG: 5'-nucleotidase C-terminal domain-containing protein [Bacteroidales bacterium]|nr:5'-nucleotidase C-terminal domain-containing protein [Bacteroidales bacterium]